MSGDPPQRVEPEQRAKNLRAKLHGPIAAAYVCELMRQHHADPSVARPFGPSFQCLLWSEHPWDRFEGRRSNSADTTAQVSRAVDRATQTRGSHRAVVATNCET